MLRSEVLPVAYYIYSGIILFILLLTILLYRINVGLLDLKTWARTFQIAISVLGLLAFPIGTIIYGICLYFMCFDTQTVAAFERGVYLKKDTEPHLPKPAAKLNH